MRPFGAACFLWTHARPGDSAVVVCLAVAAHGDANARRRSTMIVAVCGDG